MNETRPPTLGELMHALAIYGDSGTILANIIAEVPRLRELCARARDFFSDAAICAGSLHRSRNNAYKSMLVELDRASRGEI